MTNRTFKTGESRDQANLLPPRIEDYVGPDNPVRAIESFVCALDLAKLGFRHADRGMEVGQPPYDPADLLKLYLYGYINQVRSSRRLEREACRNLELIWLLRNLRPRRGAYFAPLNRINQNKEFFNSLWKIQPLAMAVLGPHVEDIFLKVHEARRHIEVAAQMLMEDVDDSHRPQAQRLLSYTSNCELIFTDTGASSRRKVIGLASNLASLDRA